MNDCVAATKYITENYTHFVDQITVKPVDDDCRSVFSQSTNYPCTHGVSWLSNNIYFNDDISPVADNIIEECRLANKCFAGTECYSIYSKYLLDWCESAKKEGLQFHSCLNKLRKDNQDYSNHYCALNTVTKKDRGDDFLMQFELNRECLKYMMMEKCGTDSIRGFNEYFEKVVLRKKAEEVKSDVDDEDDYDDDENDYDNQS